jgi:GBP family porin
MKKSLVALAALSSVAGVAQAASSVTLYGRADIGYEKVTGDTGTRTKSITQETSLSNKSTRAGNTRIGIKGQEDLGNGLAATFQLEGRFSLDTGNKPSARTFFDRESTVGLKGSFGHVRFGRSTSALDSTMWFMDPGRRFSSHDAYSSWSSGRHSNSMFYNHKIGDVEFGGNVTTKGGAAELDDTRNTSVEGNDGTKISYGLFAKYKANGLTAAAAYQADQKTATTLATKGPATNLLTIAKNEWAVGLAYKYRIVEAGVSYAQAKSSYDGKAKTMAAFITADVTPNDIINVVFRQQKDTHSVGVYRTSLNEVKNTRYGLGYIHKLSKRTSVYADVAREITQTTVGTTSTKLKLTGYDIGVRHNF